MGNTQIEQKQELMFQNYKSLGDQGKLKLFQQKETGKTFALQEDCFANKNEYESKFKKLTQKHSLTLSDNILQLVKLWSKEHTGICSHLYKIYTLYEYPQVKLIDQIQARKRQGKYFEEVELFSIIQSCLNAISVDSTYLNISPHCIFILPEGILKLLHPHLIDGNASLMYNQDYYYSPQKMANFNVYHQNFDKMQKQTIFSLGMTILHCVLLESPKFCYEITMKRFNYRKLEVLLSEVTSLYSPHLHNLLSKMLALNPFQRPTFDGLQTSLNSFFSNGVSLVSSLYRSNCQPNKQIACQKQNEINNISQKTSLQTLNRFAGSTKGDTSIHIAKNKPSFDEFSLKELPFIKERPNYHLNSQSVKKAGGKQNLYSDSKILEMIRQGMEKIHTSNKNRDKNSLSIVENKNQVITFSQAKQELNNSIQALLVSNQEKTVENKSKCMFVIQTYHDQTHFEGMLCDGIKQGYGKLTYPDGVYYQGNFQKDTLHARGSLYYGSNRPAYIGQWNHNKFHGYGVLYNEFPAPLLLTFNYQDFNRLGEGWIKYEGDFIEDIKCGKGRIILSNGQLMQGIFEKGLLNGAGTFTDLYGKKITGFWKDNVLVE